MKINIIHIFVAVCMVFFVTAVSATPLVIKQEGKVYIQDHTGDMWEVTQAESLGFKAERFQYGIGKTAFTSLDDSLLSTGLSFSSRNLRVIGLANNDDARAYSVPKLRYHEIANTRIGEKKVAVGY